LHPTRGGRFVDKLPPWNYNPFNIARSLESAIFVESSLCTMIVSENLERVLGQMNKMISLWAGKLAISIRVFLILAIVLIALGAPPQVTTVYADKLVCGIPGRDGPASIGGIVNTYYPGAANVTAGSTSIPVGAPAGAGTAIQAGDLLVVMQMQGADIDSTNTGSYGDGTAGDPGSGNLGTNFSAGLYEYVVATSGVVANSVSISSGLVNNYFDQDYPVGAGSQGQRRFQVIRVPQ
jgi:hypothetical protein